MLILIIVRDGGRWWPRLWGIDEQSSSWAKQASPSEKEHGAGDLTGGPVLGELRSPED